MGIRDKINQAKEKVEENKAAREAEWSGKGIVWQGLSHESGRNSTVTLYPDRIERVKEKAFSAFSKAKQDTEVTPIKSVSSVQAKKDGIMFTKVIVFASGNEIEFRIPHNEAQRFKDEVMKLVLKPSESSAPTAAAPDPLDQLKKLAELRDSGVINPEEFEAKKKQLLGL